MKAPHRVRADLHNHAANIRQFNSLIDVMASRLGEDGILGLLDFFEHRHFSRVAQLPGYERSWLDDRQGAFYVNEKRIVVIGGQELETQDGELVAIGLPLKARLERGRSLEDALKWSKGNGAITLAVHPFYIDGIGPALEKRPALLDYVDAVEVFNPCANFWLPAPPFLGCRHANIKALRFYQEVTATRTRPIGACCSSDSHYLSGLGTSFTVLPLPDKQDFNRSLAAGVRTATPADLVKTPTIRHAARHIGAIALPILMDKLTGRRA